MNLSKYLVNASTVCSWDGENQRAADNFNRIYHALDMRISPVLIIGKEPQWDPELYNEIMSRVRDDWMRKKDMLLKLTDEQIAEYVESQAAIYHISPVLPPVVDNVEVLRAP
ncbi:MAG: hypothetical protein O2845_02925 [Proteobacteria bacterium]|nr:hypothetical protein [Pseudomonadota bacterium]